MSKNVIVNLYAKKKISISAWIKWIFRINKFDNKNSQIYLLSNKILLTLKFQRRNAQNSRARKEYFWPLNNKEKGSSGRHGGSGIWRNWSSHGRRSARARINLLQIFQSTVCPLRGLTGSLRGLLFSRKPLQTGRDTYQIQNVAFSCIPHHKNFLSCCRKFSTHRSLYRFFLLSHKISIERTNEYPGKRPWRQEAQYFGKAVLFRWRWRLSYLTVVEIGSNSWPTINVQSDSAFIEKDTNLSWPWLRFSRVFLFLVSS